MVLWMGTFLILTLRREAWEGRWGLKQQEKKGGGAVGGGWKRQVKSRGAGQGGGKYAKNGFVQTLTAGRIRWRVPELTPNTPGPAASADYPSLTHTCLTVQRDVSFLRFQKQLQS